MFSAAVSQSSVGSLRPGIRALREWRFARATSGVRLLRRRCFDLTQCHARPRLAGHRHADGLVSLPRRRRRTEARHRSSWRTATSQLRRRRVNHLVGRPAARRSRAAAPTPRPAARRHDDGLLGSPWRRRRTAARRRLADRRKKAAQRVSRSVRPWAAHAASRIGVLSSSRRSDTARNNARRPSSDGLAV